MAAKKEKKSFVLYADTVALTKMLSDEQAGEVFKAIAEYVETGETVEIEDPASNMLFRIMKNQIDRDTAKYEEKCARMRENAMKRKGANGSDCCQIESDNKNINGSENESGNVNEPVPVNNRERKSEIDNVPPNERFRCAVENTTFPPTFNDDPVEIYRRALRSQHEKAV